LQSQPDGKPVGTGPVFVVVVNLNRWRDTVECLETVFRSDYPDVHVLLVDNGSTDDSVDRFAEWASGVRPYERPASDALAHLSWPPIPKPITHDLILRQDPLSSSHRVPLVRLTIIANFKNEGFSVGNNIGLRLILESGASGYALLINNDMVIAPDAISALVNTIERDPRIAATGGVLFDYAQPETVQMVGGATSTALGVTNVLGAGLKRGQVPAAMDLGFVGGGCLLIRLSTLREVGLLDEAFFLYGEDYDWGKRMRDRGYRLTYAPEAEAWHKGSVTTVSRSPFQDYHMVRSLLTYTRKHEPRRMLAAFGYSLFRSLAPKILRGEWTRARAVLSAYADHVRG
jgi:GT2 family glycosyltransferase